MTDDHFNLFRGGGQMGSLMRAYDWDSHPLGNPAHWPDSYAKFCLSHVCLVVV